MTSVYQFIDYRKYLAAYYQGQKKKIRRFSYRYFAEQAGISSSSFLQRVIEGHRNLTARTTAKFVKAIGFTPKEVLYFKHLVRFNQAKTALEKQEHYMILRSMSGNVKESILQANQYDFFDKWYTVVIRELICLKNFKEDYETMAKMVNPAVSASDAKKAVQRLLKLGLVKKEKEGGYRQTDKVIKADRNISSMAVRSFVKTMLGHAAEAMYRLNKKERHISSMTLGVSPACYDLIGAEIEAFRDRIKTIVDSNKDSNRVYQLNLQLFPVSAELDNNTDHKNGAIDSPARKKNQ